MPSFCPPHRQGEGLLLKPALCNSSQGNVQKEGRGSTEKELGEEMREHTLTYTCEGNLAFCTVCKGAEGSLTTECCGRPITEEEEHKIKHLFKNGEISAAQTAQKITKLRARHFRLHILDNPYAGTTLICIPSILILSPTLTILIFRSSLFKKYRHAFIVKIFVFSFIN